MVFRTRPEDIENGMTDQVITGMDQVTPAWLTDVLSRSEALTRGAVAWFDAMPGKGHWSANALLDLRYANGSRGTLPRRLFI